MKFTADVAVDLYGVENTRLITRGLVTLKVLAIIFCRILSSSIVLVKNAY